MKNLVKGLKLEGQMVFLDYVPEEDLSYLYSGARAFILPSLHEGFGFLLDNCSGRSEFAPQR